MPKKKKEYTPVKAGNQPTEAQQEGCSDALALAGKHIAASGIFFQSPPPFLSFYYFFSYWPLQQGIALIPGNF